MARVLTVGELRAALEDWADDAPVRVAYQPGFPLVALLEGVRSTFTRYEGHDPATCWLVVGGAPPEGEPPYAPRELFG